MTNLDAAKGVIMELLRPDECAPGLILIFAVRQRLECTSDEARAVAMAAIRELCDAREVVEMSEGFRRKDVELPPYVFPDRRPTTYDSNRKGELWVMCGPVYTDGTGWRWDKTAADELVDGDIWVPIHLLHSEPIPKIAERSRQLQSGDHAHP
jgi:hypothetical protein